jgi:hypothetical protein
MAKVSTIKCEVNGTLFNINVNCTSSGEFNANIPEFVATALRIKSKLTATTLRELETTFHAALKQYKQAETKEELFIAISYKARGRYAQKRDKDESGHTLNLFYTGNRGKYDLDVSFDRPKNALGFDFSVVIKETIDQKVKWHKTQLGSKFSSWMDTERYAEPDKYHKYGEFYYISEYKVIPFSEAALASLQNAQEKLRSISEMLFNFIEQDEEQILLALTNHKLLN